MNPPVRIGEIVTPTGVIAIVDMGLMGQWGDDALPHVVIEDVPKHVPLAVFGLRMPEGEFGSMWRAVYVDCVDQPRAARSDSPGQVVVDMARLIIADVDALDLWVHDESIDGRADFVFWGRDAESAAKQATAPALGDGTFGWIDLPIDRAMTLGGKVEEHRAARGLRFATDFRPHSHHYQVMRQVRASKTESGVISLGGATLCGFTTTWGDGVFPVMRDFDEAGNLTRFGVALGTKDAEQNLRAVN